MKDQANTSGHDFAEDAILYGKHCDEIRAYAEDADRDALIRARAYRYPHATVLTRLLND
jgi:hypothetical protein